MKNPLIVLGVVILLLAAGKKFESYYWTPRLTTAGNCVESDCIAEVNAPPDTSKVEACVGKNPVTGNISLVMAYGTEPDRQLRGYLWISTGNGSRMPAERVVSVRVHTADTVQTIVPFRAVGTQFETKNEKVAQSEFWLPCFFN